MIFLILGLGFIFFLSPFIFGSKTDWLGQHTAFPEYFRNLFYQTGNFFPNFSIHLGAGQNIFNFAYYGLLNPIILLSYFLPFVPMQTYIIVTSLLSILVSMILLYYFFKPKLGDKIAFFSVILYFFACPIIFHAHRHIMFVNYMPFLILGLIGVDNYFIKKKTGYMTWSVFFMIISSYYYSIGGIISLVIYGIYHWLKKNSFEFKKFLKDGFIFIIPIFIGILCSAFYLLPTAYALLCGRESSNHSISILTLFLPNFNISNILYTAYSLGLTSIFIFADFYFITSRKRENKWLGILFFLLCFIPIFIYILNGTLYVRSKVLIPFLPLAIYLIGVFLKDVIERKDMRRFFIFSLVIFHVAILMSGYFKVFYYIDVILVICAIILYTHYSKTWLLLLPILAISLITSISVNLSEGYVKKSYSNQVIEHLINEIPVTDNLWRTSVQENTLYGINQIYGNHQFSTSLYSSVYNSEYSNFFKDTVEHALPYRNRFIHASTNNLLFSILMAERYIVASCEKEYIGYHKLAEEQDKCLYENEYVYPFGYGSDQLMHQSAFKNLEYPYHLEALLNSIIVSDSVTTNFEFNSQLEELSMDVGSIQIGKNLKVEKTINGYEVIASEKDTMIYALEKPMSKVLLIDFDVVNAPSCKTGDISITINGITNKLTCSSWEYKNENHRFAYVISENNIEALEIKFTKGKYLLENFHIYALDYEEIQNNQKDKYPFLINQKKTKDNQIVGNIEMEADGYFVLSIPYDQGFHIKVDGTKVDVEKVNTSFLGFPLEKGNHQIEIKYQAPYFKIGKWISLFTFIFYAVYMFLKNKMSNKL